MTADRQRKIRVRPGDSQGVGDALCPGCGDPLSAPRVERIDGTVWHLGCAQLDQLEVDRRLETEPLEAAQADQRDRQLDWAGRGLEPFERSAFEISIAGAAVAVELKESDPWWELVHDAATGTPNRALARRIGRYGSGRRRYFIEALLAAAAAHHPDRIAGYRAMLSCASAAASIQGSPGRRTLRRQLADRTALAAETIARRGAGSCICCDTRLSGGGVDSGKSGRPVVALLCSACSSNGARRFECERREKAAAATFELLAAGPLMKQPVPRASCAPVGP